MKRDEASVIQDFLMCVDHYVTLKEIESWSEQKLEKISAWASAVHLKASDNSYIRVPKKPAFKSKPASEALKYTDLAGGAHHR